jgi:SAM-dependent methyltransferase
VERAEYERMHAVEDRMWWYRGLRALVVQELARVLKRCEGAGPVLDAGCGTGGMLARLGPSIAGRPTIGLEYDAIAAAMAGSKSGRPVASGSVNEMPLGDGTLAGYVSLDVPLPWRRRPGARRKGGAALPQARRDRAVQSAGLWVDVVDA